MAGKGPGGESPPSRPDERMATNAEKFDSGLVAAYERLVAARERRDEKAFRGAFQGGADAASFELYSESVTPRLLRIQHQFQNQDIQGDRATLVVKERIEERDPKDPKGEVHGQEAAVTATLVRTGGAWVVSALQVDWK